MSPMGKSSCRLTNDGILVVSAKEQILASYASMVDQLLLFEVPSWVVQLYFFEFKDTEELRKSIDLSASGSVAFRFLEPDIAQKSGMFSDMAFRSLLDYSRSSDNLTIVSQPVFVLREGADVVFENTDSIPYVKRVATEEGFIADSDVEFIDAGLSLKVALREMQKGALLTLDLKNTKILSINDIGLPRLNRVSLASEVPIRHTGIYMLAQSDYKEFSKSFKSIGENTASSKTLLQVYARCFRVHRDFKGVQHIAGLSRRGDRTKERSDLQLPHRHPDGEVEN